MWMDGVVEGLRDIDSAGIYTLEVVDVHGCRANTFTKARQVNCIPLSFMPSAFSPNADGINDFFGPSWQEGIVGYEMRVFNRWGQKVYDSTNPIPGWDGSFRGEACPEGVYIYRLTYYTDLPTVSHYTGSVTLIR